MVLTCVFISCENKSGCLVDFDPDEYANCVSFTDMEYEFNVAWVYKYNEDSLLLKHTIQNHFHFRVTDGNGSAEPKLRL